MSHLPASGSFQPDASHAWPMSDADQPAVRILRHADLTADDRAQWAALSALAGAANVFAQDWFMDAALSHAPDGADVLLAVVAPIDGPWLGVIPLIAVPRFGRWPVRIWRNWSATNQFLGTPLVIAQSADLFWKSLFAFLDQRTGGEIMLHVSGLDADDPVSIALFDRCERERRAFHIIHCHDRPAYRAGKQGEGRSDAKMRSRLRSLSKRLEQDHGPVTIDILASDAPCTAWIDAFLDLEASGWKGRSGSALASDGATQALFCEVIERGHANGSARLATLSVGGRAIAMSSWFEAAIWGHGFKMAFDEDYRAYAPGQLLMRDIRDRIGGRPGMSFDSCVPRGAGHCHRLWGSNRKIVDGAVAIGSPWHHVQFDALMKARAAYAAIKARFPDRPAT